MANDWQSLYRRTGSRSAKPIGDHLISDASSTAPRGGTGDPSTSGCTPEIPYRASHRSSPTRDRRHAAAAAPAFQIAEHDARVLSIGSMKKQIRSKKLKLKTETVHELTSAKLVVVNGGATDHCTHPTTTVLPSGPC